MHSYIKNCVFLADTSQTVAKLGGAPAKTVRGFRVCLVVPQATSSTLVIAEAQQPPFEALRTVETCRHIFRLMTQHGRNPLVYALQERYRSICIKCPNTITNFSQVMDF